MTNTWHGKDLSSDLPLWDKEHPLFKALGLAARTVETPDAATEIEIPDIDEDLQPVVAAFAVMFTGKFYRAQRQMPTIALETLALLYVQIGGTDATWQEYLDKIGVKVAPQSRNLFVSFLRFICGNRPDPSNRLGKMANALAKWASIYQPPADDNNPDDWGHPSPSPASKDPF